MIYFFNNEENEENEENEWNESLKMYDKTQASISCTSSSLL